MASPETTTWSRLPRSLRTELRGVVRSGGDAFHSQYHDAMAWWLLLMLACVAAGGAAAWDLATSGFDLGEWGLAFLAHPMGTFIGFLRAPQRLGLLAAVAVGAWVGTTWVRNHNRRGLALTSDAVVVVRGHRLRVLRYAGIASAERTSHGRLGSRFTVLTLRTRGGEVLTLYTTARWADAAAERITATAAASPSTPA